MTSKMHTRAKRKSVDRIARASFAYVCVRFTPEDKQHTDWVSSGLNFLYFGFCELGKYTLLRTPGTI